VKFLKKILIIQNELPEYRNFLWLGLRKKFQLYLLNISNSTVILPCGSCKFYTEEIINVHFDTVVVNASIRNILSIIKYKYIYNYDHMYGWTQFSGANKSNFLNLIKYLFYVTFFKKILLYYEFEKKLIPFGLQTDKFYFLNNTIENQHVVIDGNRNSKEFLFIGRNTIKSNLQLLFKAINLLPCNYIFHFVGVKSAEISEFNNYKQCIFYGSTSDKNFIAKIASRCKYFVYPGDVGLSVIHAIKLGLIPIVHSEIDKHMPELKAIYGELPIMYFKEGSYQSLAVEIKRCAESDIDISQEVMKYADKKFDENIAINNFIKLIIEN